MAKRNKVVATQGGFSTHDTIKGMRSDKGVDTKDKVQAKPKMTKQESQADVLAQQLIKKVKGDRKAAFNIMIKISATGRDGGALALARFTTACNDERALIKLSDYTGEKSVREAAAKAAKASVTSSWSRYITIAKAIASDSTYNFSGCSSLNDMIGVARSNSTHSSHTATLAPKAVESLTKNLKRIVTLNGHDVSMDNERTRAEVARFEHIGRMYAAQYAVISAKLPGLVPLVELLTVRQPVRRNHLRRAA